MKLLTGILLLNLVALSLGQYDFFDNYVKNFLKNVFSGGRSRTPSSTSGKDAQDLRPQVCDCSFRNDNRIINGRKSELIPWLVSLGYVFKSGSTVKYNHFCAAAILNERTLLTAGHCLKDLTMSAIPNLLARFALTNLNDAVTSQNTVPWLEFKIHQKYIEDPENNDNDIGIVKLAKPIDLRNSRAKAACLDFTNEYSSFLSLSGWGRTTPFGRHNQTGATLPNELLQLDMKEEKAKSTESIISAVGKAKNSGTCSGDSGSPLQSVSARKVTVVGLVSYGISNKDGIFCLSNTGFVRLQAHRRFIEDYVGAENFCRG